MNRNQLRLAAVATVAALALGGASGIANASSFTHERTAQAAVQAHAAAGVFADAGAPAIQEDGLAERFAALPAGPDVDRIVDAMYPGDPDAQQQALLALAGDTGSATPYGFWGTTWNVTKCVAAIGAFVAGNAFLASKLAKLGGVVKGARLVVMAGNFQERMQALISIFGEVTGISTVAGNCG